MNPDFTERKIPRRKDRINLTFLLYLLLVALPIISIPFPWIEENLFGEIPFLYFILFVMVGLVGNFYQWWSWQHAWENFSIDYGMRLEKYSAGSLSVFKEVRLVGGYQGYLVNIERTTRGSGRRKKVFTSISFPLRNANDLTLNIARAKWYAPPVQAVTNNEVFNKKISVKCENESFARNVFLSTTVQQGLVELLGQAPEMNISVQFGKLYYEEKSLIKDVNYLKSLLNLLTEIAGAVDRYGL